MSSEAGLIVSVVVGDAEQQNSIAMSQSIQAAQQWILAQTFELGISQVTGQPTGASACQQSDLVCRKAAQNNTDSFAFIVPEMRARSMDTSAEFGRDAIAYADQFSQRAKRYTSEIEDAIRKIGEPPKLSSTGATTHTPSFDPSTALRLLQRTFEFALECYLISNVSSSSTRIFNQLMKEQ